MRNTLIAAATGALILVAALARHVPRPSAPGDHGGERTVARSASTPPSCGPSTQEARGPSSATEIGATSTLQEAFPDANGTAVPETNESLMKQFLAAADDEERERVLDGMSKFDAPSTIPFFAAIARDSSRYSSRIRVRGVIGLNLRDCPEAVQTLWEVAQNDPDPSVRFMALEGMGTNVDCREQVLPLLLSALGNAEVRVRQGAVAGLQFLSDPRAVSALAAWIEMEPDLELAADGAVLLGQYDGVEATERLRDLAARHRDPGVRERAWEALLDRGDAAAREGFRRRAAGGDAEARGRLAANGDDVSTEALVEALRGENGADVARGLIRRALEGDSSAVESLEQALSPEWPDEARFRAAASLVRAGALPHERAEACLASLAREDGVAEVRMGALTELFHADARDGLALCEAAAARTDEAAGHAVALIEAWALYRGRRDEAEMALMRLRAQGLEVDAALHEVRYGKSDREVKAWVRGDGLPPARLKRGRDPVGKALLRR